MAADSVADAIAIVGLSCRLPGAPDFESLGALLAEGREGLCWLSRGEQEAAGVPARLLDDPRLVPAAGLLAGVTDFDVDYFRMPVGEATILDPQHRLMLELGREALDDAGYPPGSIKEQTGIYVGTEVSDYFLHHLLPALDGPLDPRWKSQLYLNDKDSLAAQVAYRLGLAGPCSVVQGVCATGLLALHEGVKSLLDGECDLALIGAVALRLPQRSGYLHQPGGPLSADGHTRSFDARGTGTVYGSGGAVLVLRRYEDALRRGDRVHALVRGSAVYTDGRARSSFTVPTVKGHIQVLAEALAVASLVPAEIQYIEGTGTATPIGDALELSAIAQVYKGQRLHVGSLHSNLGHLQAASGLAGLLKVVWMLREGTIPATLHFEHPNEALSGQSLTVNREPVAWPKSAGPRRAGVNALGTGGIYSHVLVEEAPNQPVARPTAGPFFLPLSAASSEALRTRALDFAAWLRRHPQDVAAICYTASLRRSHEATRWSVVGLGAEDLAQKLESWAGGQASSVPPALQGSGLVFDAARLYQSGALPDWTRLYPNGGRVVSLPAACWQRIRCWSDEPRTQRTAAACFAESASAAGSTLEALLHRVEQALPPGAASVSPSTSLSALGLGSLDLLALLATLEREHPRLSAKMLEAPWGSLTLAELAQLLQDSASPRRSTPAALPEGAADSLRRPSPGAPYEERVIRVAGRDTQVLLAGAGPPLLLLPPLGTTAAAWLPALPLLSREFRVIVPTLPGFGQSAALDEASAESPSAVAPEARVAAHLVAMLDALGQNEPVHLVGWSYGGCLALRLALSHTRRVASLALVCSTGRPLLRPSFAWLQALLALLTASIETELAHVTEPERTELGSVFSASASPHPGTQAQAQGLLHFNVLPELETLVVPTLVICGEQDQVMPLTHAQELTRRIAHSALTIVPEAGHLLPATHAAAFVALLSGFVKGTGETSC